MRKILTHGQISGLTDRSIEGKKTWDDSNNADRLRPVSIQEWTVYFIHGTGFTNVNGYTVSISESGTGFTESFLNMQRDLYLSCDRRQFYDTIYYRFRTDKQGYLWVDQGSEE